MRKMKRVIALVVLALMLCGCSPETVSVPVERVYMLINAAAVSEKFAGVVVSENAPVIKAYWIYLMDLNIDFDVEGEIDDEVVANMFAAVSDDVSNPNAFVRELPAGDVLSVSFTVNSSIDKETLVSSLANSFTMSVEGDVTNTFAHSYSVKVCAGHTDSDKDDVCDNCGENMVLMGDVNGDGKINTRDALLTLRYASKKITESDLNLAAADVNGDGKVNTRDALLILRYASKKITEFPLS